MTAWTEEEDELLRKLYERGDLSIAKIAGKMEGRNKNQVLGRLHRLGIAGSPLSPIVSELAKRFQAATVLEISEACAAEIHEIKKGLSYASTKRDLGSVQTYNSALVAEMRAHLGREAA